MLLSCSPICTSSSYRTRTPDSFEIEDALLNVKAEDLIAPDPDGEVVKGTANRSGCWYHAPAHMEFFVNADKRLTRVADLAGMNVKRVDKVQVKLINGTKLVVIKAARPDDLTAILVNRYSGAHRTPPGAGPQKAVR